MITFVLLARTFRSLVIAPKAVLLNLISMAGAFGVMTWFWQQGHGSSLVFGIPPTGAITFWIPLMVFAFLFRQSALWTTLDGWLNGGSSDLQGFRRGSSALR